MYSAGGASIGTKAEDMGARVDQASVEIVRRRFIAASRRVMLMSVQLHICWA